MSTNALIAPFAFTRPDFDDFLSKVYTTVIASDIDRRRFLITELFSNPMADADPLRDLLDKHIN